MRKKNFFILLKSALILTILSLFLGMMPSSPQEGMFPLSEIHNLGLNSAGLKISQNEIYNPDGVSLVDALVQLGGCTGSFVSKDGLIITNHHCAFGAINQASTVKNNYLENGFYAKNYEEEFAAKGYTCKITESYEDVSDKILDAVKNINDPAERTKLISLKMKELAATAEDKQNSITAQVSEMFAGKSYVLFRYKTIKDIRLVFAPPLSIGNFGGETDNWVWPRHTGDFSFMRAYVAPDGSAAEYSKDNVPYHPKKFLKINPKGVEEGDFVFLLGYPGRTFRHRPSQYFIYQKEYLLPYISSLYSYAIDQLEKLSKESPELKLKFASRIKSLANTMKNYKGKLLGFHKIDLIGNKENEEKELTNFINGSPQLKEKYGSLFNEITDVYNNFFKTAKADLWLRQIFNLSAGVSLANYVWNYSEQTQLPNDKRDDAYKDKNINSTLAFVNRIKSMYNPEFEKNIFLRMLNDASKFEPSSRIQAVDYLINNKINFIQFSNDESANKIFDDEYFSQLLTKTPDELEELNDPLLNFVKKVKEQNKTLSRKNDEIEGKLNKLYGELIDVKSEWKKTNFIPDANGTLRLTYGYIKGYYPADAVYYAPITTLEGVIEKAATGEEDYVIPEKLRRLYEKKDYGQFYDAKVKGLPIAILYDADTSGGNSGSPIMNAYGELIGVNFDRAYGATINDFAWNESYSRSIGVDIRYVLWVTQKIGGADSILKELGINF